MITLAPEICSEEVIEFILSQGIKISAGHSNASYSQAMRGFEKGISLVTHLYNAMSPLHHREPGLAGAAMDHDKVMASIIPDGIHIDFAALRIAKKAMGHRLFAITDAVTETTEGDYQHIFAGDKYEAAGILSGSALGMNQALLNLNQQGGIELGEALRMCSLYPARALGIENERGRLLPGYIAEMVLLNKRGEFIKLIN
jgi:N-acetylglucosamine-6-phosphate deacetylase